MTKVFQVTPYGRFIEIQSNLKRKKLYRTNYMKTSLYMPPPYIYLPPPPPPPIPDPLYIPTSPNFVHPSPPPSKPLFGALFVWLNV